MKRTTAGILALTWCVAGYSAVLAQSRPPSSSGRFDVFEKSILELQDAMERGETTSSELVHQYLERIEAFDERGAALNSFVYINPHAIEEARALDRERVERGPRGPLHGIPIALKDNYDTRDMPTSGGSIALTGFVPPDDGYQVKKLREAGAVFIGKTNMHELARGITTISSLGGQTLNPYDPKRNPGGSSGGTGAAVAADLAAVGMGSDTCGSIRIPAANNNLFGLRVTQGLSSRDGIIPLSHTQDVGGPLARSMTDLALVLDATVGPDPADPQTALAEGNVPTSYRAFLKPDGLDRVRLGLLTSYLREDGPEQEVTNVVKQAVSVMTDHGATAIQIAIQGLDEALENSGVIGMEFKFDLRDYLKRSGAPVSSLTEILDRGLYHDALSVRFRTSAEAQEGSEDYKKALAQRDLVSRLLREAMEDYELDAIVYPTLRNKPARIGEPQFGTSCAMAAHSGLPAITLPAGFTPDGVPVGVELLGHAFREGDLIAIGYAYEQAARPRRSPPRTPSLVRESLSKYFELASPLVRGRLRLDRPTQRLHYDLEISNVLDEEILDIKLHRAGSGENGPVIALLGRARHGEVAIPNEDLEPLLKGDLYLVIYTRDAPLGAFRAQIIDS
jgi:amidase